MVKLKVGGSLEDDRRRLFHCLAEALRTLGAVPLKRSAYLLPDTPERYEDFQWLAQ